MYKKQTDSEKSLKLDSLNIHSVKKKLQWEFWKWIFLAHDPIKRRYDIMPINAIPRWRIEVWRRGCQTKIRIPLQENHCHFSKIIHVVFSFDILISSLFKHLTVGINFLQKGKPLFTQPRPTQPSIVLNKLFNIYFILYRWYNFD